MFCLQLGNLLDQILTGLIHFPMVSKLDFYLFDDPNQKRIQTKQVDLSGGILRFCYISFESEFQPFTGEIRILAERKLCFQEARSGMIISF
jgi:hypothetical protein